MKPKCNTKCNQHVTRNVTQNVTSPLFNIYYSLLVNISSAIIQQYSTLVNICFSIIQHPSAIIRDQSAHGFLLVTIQLLLFAISQHMFFYQSPQSTPAFSISHHTVAIICYQSTCFSISHHSQHLHFLLVTSQSTLVNT